MENTTKTPTTPETTDSANLSRGEFMRSLGLSTGALMAFYCLGTTMTSCKKDDSVTPTPTPTPSGNAVTGTTTGNAINFTVDLTHTDAKVLKTAGSTAKVGDVFIANAKNGFIAVQKLCTHAGQDNLTYRSANDDILCTAHGSEFKTDGTVNKGPAATALKRYTATLSADGNTLTIKA